MLFEHREVFLEVVCDKVFQIMIAIENRRDFDKRSKFKYIIEVFLKKKRSTSSRFIEYCELMTKDDDFEKFTKITMKKK